MRRRIRNWFHNNWWFILTVGSCLFWVFMISMLFWLFPLETKADGYEMTQEELEEEMYYDSLELLAVCVEAEAGNQDLLGKRLVVDVVLNRVDDPDWPDNITDVITQPYQFSSYWDGGMDRVWEPSEETFQAVIMELEKRTYTDIYYFTAGRYSEYGTPWKKIGDHYFSRK